MVEVASHHRLSAFTDPCVSYPITTSSPATFLRISFHAVCYLGRDFFHPPVSENPALTDPV